MGISQLLGRQVDHMALLVLPGGAFVHVCRKFELLNMLRMFICAPEKTGERLGRSLEKKWDTY